MTFNRHEIQNYIATIVLSSKDTVAEFDELDDLAIESQAPFRGYRLPIKLKVVTERFVVPPRVLI